MKKLTVVLAALMLCLQVFSGTVAYGATGDKITITNYTTSESSISEGDSFDMVVFCGNKTGDVLEDVDVSISGSSSFAVKTSGSITKFNTLAGNASDEIMFPELIYKGNGNELILVFSYTVGTEEYTETEIIYVTEAESEEDDDSSDPVNTAKYVPKLRIGNINKIPVVIAGNTYKLKYSIENYSSYQARKMNISLKMADEAKAPLVLDSFDMRQSVDSIISNTSKDVEFELVTLKTAPEGLYMMKLSFEFENAYGDQFTHSETAYIRIQNDNVTPRLVVDNVSVNDKSEESDAFKLELGVKNLGNIMAKSIKVTLGGLKSGGFMTHNSPDVQYIDSIGGRGSATVGYDLVMPAGGAAASNELSVKFEYRDAVGNTYTEQNQIFVPVGDEEGNKPEVAFEKIVSPQGALTANEEFSVGFDLKNNGGVAARNVKVTMTADQGVVIKSINPVYVEKLDQGEAKGISYKLFASDDAVTKNYPIALKAEYEDAFGNKYEATQYIGAYVENSTGKTVPRIIIDNYSMDPFPVNAGEDFNLRMSFLNTSKTVDVSNIKVTVTSDDGTFTPTDTGNTFFLESIPSKQSVERELLLHVKPDAEQKSYMLSVNFEYEDDKGNPYTAKETMSVRVLQNPRLVTGDISLMPDTFVGQPVSIYLDFYNMGKSTLYNLMVKAEGDFQGQNLSYYVGNFESGRTDFFDVSITPMTAGTQKGSILFTFEDANGKAIEMRKEFSLNVMEMEPQGPMVDENGMPIDPGMGFPGKGRMPGGMQGQKTSLLVYIIPGAAVLVIAVIVFIILRKRHVRRKEMSLDE